MKNKKRYINQIPDRSTFEKNLVKESDKICSITKFGNELAHKGYSWITIHEKLKEKFGNVGYDWARILLDLPKNNIPEQKFKSSGKKNSYKNINELSLDEKIKIIRLENPREIQIYISQNHPQFELKVVINWWIAQNRIYEKRKDNEYPFN